MEGEREFIPCAAYLLDDGTISPIGLFYPKNKYNQLSKFLKMQGFPPAAALGTSEVWKNLEGLPALRVWAEHDEFRAVHQFSGGMLTPSVAIAVDHGCLIPGSQYRALTSNVNECDLPPVPGTDFHIPTSDFHIPKVLVPREVDYHALFSGIWTGLPPKLENASKELRFMSLPVNSPFFAIPCAAPEGKMMVAAGYGGHPIVATELANFISTYHPELINKSSATQLQATGPSLREVQVTFSSVVNRLAVAPGNFLKTLFQGSIFCVNASLTVGHCGSMLYDMEDPSLFYGVYSSSVRNAETNKVDNYVWSTVDPVFVHGWIQFALPYFLGEAFSSRKALVAIVDYLERVNNTAIALGHPNALTNARNKLASIPL